MRFAMVKIIREAFDPNIAHIEAKDGAVFQVLNAEGDDWDEAATRALYDAHIAAQTTAD